MWRIRKDGGLARADRAALLAEKRETPAGPTKTYTLLGVARGQAPTIRAASLEAPDVTVNAVNDLVRRIAIVVLGTIAVVGMLAVFVPSPLEEPANALITPNPAKAPWYFLWLQEIVTITTVRIGKFTINGAFLGGVILPGILLALTTFWPWLDRSGAAGAGVWFAARPEEAERRLPRDLPRDRPAHRRRDLHARPVLALLLALAGVARNPVEDLTWKSGRTLRTPGATGRSSRPSASS